MSLLKSLKGKFQNVQQDIVDGFRALNAANSPTRRRKVGQLEGQGITLDAGADLLNKYQNSWSEMQSYTTDSTIKAEEVDLVVKALLAEWERRGLWADHLEQEAALLPAMASTLNDTLGVIESLCEDFRAVEKEMDRLQNIAEEEELRQEQLSHHAQLTAYTKRRRAEASAVKSQLWKTLKEKSKELKAKGHKSPTTEGGQDSVTEMDHLSSASSNSPSKERLQPENDSRDVGSGNADQPHSVQASADEGEHGEVLASEEAFIEDDYTLDYRQTMDHDRVLDEDSPIDLDNAGLAENSVGSDLTGGQEVCTDTVAQSTTQDSCGVVVGVACEKVSAEEEKM